MEGEHERQFICNTCIVYLLIVCLFFSEKMPYLWWKVLYQPEYSMTLVLDQISMPALSPRIKQRCWETWKCLINVCRRKEITSSGEARLHGRRRIFESLSLMRMWHQSLEMLRWTYHDCLVYLDIYSRLDKIWSAKKTTIIFALETNLSCLSSMSTFKVFRQKVEILFQG